MKYKYCIIRKIKKKLEGIPRELQKADRSSCEHVGRSCAFGEAAVPMQPKVSFV